MSNSTIGSAALAGVAGAVALTTVHQAARMFTSDAPRMDVLGRRAIAATIDRTGRRVPDEGTLQKWALGGDIVANSLYYSLVAAGGRAGTWRRGMALGLAAGAGALLLPQRIGLGAAPRSYSVANQIMTIAWYTIGGLAAAAVASRAPRPATL